MAIFTFLNLNYQNSKMKEGTKVLLIAATIIFLGFTSIKGFTSHIYNRTDCEQMNIDNIELRTGIDIPAVSKVVCEFKTAEQMKISVFTLDKNQVDLADYTTRNGFIQKGTQYVKSGERADTKWVANLDATTWKLTVYVKYKA